MHEIFLLTFPSSEECLSNPTSQLAKYSLSCICRCPVFVHIVLGLPESDTSLTPLFHKRTTNALITTKLLYHFAKTKCFPLVYLSTPSKATNPPHTPRALISTGLHASQDTSTRTAAHREPKGSKEEEQAVLSRPAAGVISQSDAVRKKL